MLLLVLTAPLFLAACSSAQRPAWERAAVGAPATTSSSAAKASQTVSPPATLAPPAATRPAPGSPYALPGAAPTSAKPAPPVLAPVVAKPVDAKPVDAKPVVTTPGGTPGGAPGKQVAAAAIPPKPTSDPSWIGFETHAAKHEDTLIDLAVAHGLGFIELAMANPGVDPWLPGEGTPILLPRMHLPPDAPRQGLVINLPEQRLFYYDKGKLLRSYPIGIGRDGHSTPIGSTTIVRKAANPTWYPTPSARADDPTLPAAVPAGPDNPLGNRALYLGWTSYLIHGTNKEHGIGRRASRGCIRMYPDDVIALFDKAPVGTAVTVVDQPVKVGWIADALYVEASPTSAQVQQWEEDGKFDPADPAAAREMVLKTAGAAADRIDWAAFDRAMSERRGIPTRITGPNAPALATAEPAPASAAKPSAAAAAKPSAGQPKQTAAAGAPSDPDDLVKWLRGRLAGGEP